MRVTGLPDQLRRRGLDVVEHSGWKARGSTAFAPVGVMCHHTGPYGSTSGMVNLCITGRADLRGPLCHVVLDPLGVCHVIASGLANHAGKGKWNDRTDGNTSFVGIEAMHDGNPFTRWPPKQLWAFVRCAAAIAELVGADPGMVIAHREWAPKRKVDPVGIDMAQFRSDVAEVRRKWAETDEQAVRAERILDEIEERRPMYDPPLKPIAAVWQDETGKVIAAVTPDGDIYAWGCQWVGNVRGKPYWGARRAAAIGPRDDGAEGYMITSTDRATYRLPDGMDVL